MNCIVIIIIVYTIFCICTLCDTHL